MNRYRFFSLLFLYPTAATIKEIEEASKAADLAEFRCARLLADMPPEEAQAEYTRLFISAYPSLLCPPYESFYREGIIYGNTAVEVSEIYSTHGLNFVTEGEPPDLLSAELDFLSITNDEAFLRRLKEWVFQFTERVKKHSALYGVCADELESLLA